MPRPRRTFLLKILTVLAGATAAFVISEAAIVLLKPRPGVQIISRSQVQEFGSLGDVAVWKQTTDREHTDCVAAHPERIRILFLGDSIVYGVSLPASEVFTTLLEDKLNADRPSPGFCVLNFAQPAFRTEQKVAVGSQEVVRFRPAVVLLGAWTEPGHYAMLGDAAYNLLNYAVDSDGFPELSGIPDSLNHALFLRSHLYQSLVFAVGKQTQRDGSPGARVLQHLDHLNDVTCAVGSRLGVFVCPPLNTPFDGEDRFEDADVRVFVAEHQLPQFSLGKELMGQEYGALRLDDCCHFNAAGHRALVPIFERIVLKMVDGKTPPR